MNYATWYINNIGEGRLKVTLAEDCTKQGVSEMDAEMVLHTEALSEHMFYLDNKYGTATFEID